MTNSDCFTNPRNIYRQAACNLPQIQQPTHLFVKYKMKLLLISILLVAAFPFHLRAQSHSLSMDELYRMVIKVRGTDESSEQAKARYFVNLAELQISQLKQDVDQRRANVDATRLMQQLEDVIQPITELRRFIAETELTPENVRRLSLLMRDPGIAKQVFDVFGSERATALIQGMIRTAVKQRIERSQLNSHGINCLLLDERFADAIGLSDQQKQRIAELTKSTSNKFRRGPGKEFSDLEKLLRKHWVNLRKGLDPTQEKVVERVFGSPVQWFRCVEPLRYRSRDGNDIRWQTFNASAVNLAERLGKSYAELTTEELKNEGLTLLDNHMFGMLQSNFVWDEMELSESQRKKFHNDLVQWKKQDLFIEKNRRARLGEILAGTSELPKYVSGTLNEHQLTWLKHFEFQMLTGSHESSFGLLHPQVKKHLGLTTSQQSSIKSIADQFDKQRTELETKLAERRKEILKQYSRDVARILTSKQNELYTLYTGQTLKPTESK